MHTKRTTLFAAALALALAAVLLISAAPAGEIGAEVLANSDIVALSRAGMAPQVIAAKIASSSNIFDVSSRGLLSLKQSGVADDVIATMLAAGGGGSAQPAAGILDPARLRRELENLASPGPESRASAQAWLLANRAAALPELRRSLTDREPAVRAAAVTALGDLRDGESLHAIRNLIVAPDPAVRRAAAQALYALGDSQSVNAAEQALARGVSPMDGYIRLVGHAKLTRAAGALGQVLSANPDNLNRAAAAWSLGEIGRTATAGRAALERAIEVDADAAVRRESAAAIAKFHDSGSAAVLMNACRRDPEVRSVALTGLAEYPESVEFLIGVMNLGADQIAPSELETARASLYRLTGQDYGLDGANWSNWFAGNRSAFAAAGGAPTGLPTGLPTAAATGLPPMGLPPTGFSSAAPVAGSSPLPLYSAGLGPGGAAAPAGNVDVEAWSLVADADDIPMAPQVDAPSAGGVAGLTNFAVRQPGAARPAAPPGAVDSSSIPMALSPSDFDAGDGFSLPGLTPPSTQSIPAMDIAQGTLTGAPSLPIPPMEAQQSLLGIGSAEPSSAPALAAPIAAPIAASASADPAGGTLQSGGLFRTWSSDPDRGAPEPRTEDEAPSRSFAGFPGRTDGADALPAGADSAAAAPADAALAGDAASQWRRVPAEELSGALAADGADPFASSFPDAAATGDAFAADPFATPVDPFATPPADPFAAPADAAASSSVAASPSPFGDSAPALLPTGPVITPMSATEDADADPLRGFSLSLPGMETAAADASTTVTDAAAAFVDGATSAAQSFVDTATFPGDGGVIVDDSGNVFPMPDAAGAGASLMPADASIPAYDPAALPDATALFGDEFGSADALAADPFASDPFAADASASDPFAAPGETVIFAPTPDPTPVPVPTDGDVFSDLPPLDDIARQGSAGITQSVDGALRSVDGMVQGADNAARGVLDNASQTIESITQSADGLVQDADAFAQDIQSVGGGALQSADAAIQSVNTSLFVEPEPGQVMVDENWTGSSFPTPQAASAAPVIDFPEPTVDVSMPQTDFPEPEAVQAGSAATYANPYENNPPPPNPAFITTDPDFVPPIRDYTEPYSPPPAAPLGAAAGTPARAAAGTDQPAPAAPAGRAGNAKAPAPAPAGEMPRMLGEGFFR